MQFLFANRKYFGRIFARFELFFYIKVYFMVTRVLNLCGSINFKKTCQVQLARTWLSSVLEFTNTDIEQFEEKTDL